MRNLKRVLSLALATAMLFSMMVIGASAADRKALTDLDKVNHKEAVNLMVDLGIIVGKPDGSFAPAETVDRATMSKLIYFIMMGNTDESAFKGVSTPLKDVKGNWAEGFINYCYSVNIVAGTGNNTYNPNGKVTVVSAAKMLLVALGYDPAASKYQNDTLWSVNIMRDAQSAGLLKNIDQKASEDLTRDNAAQMIYNTLFANTVKPSFQIDMGIKYLNGYDPIKDSNNVIVTLAKSNYNLTKYTGVVVANEFAALMGSVQDAGKTLVKKYDTDKEVAGNSDVLKVATDVAMLGQEVNYYTYTSKNTLSSFVTATEKTKEYTWTDSDITEAKFKTNNSLTNSGVLVSALNYIPGAVVSAAKDGTRYIDSNADGKLDFILKTAYTFSKVTKIDSTNVSITGLGTRKIADVSGSAGLKKDDYVNYALVGNAGKATVEKAAEITGTVTALKTGPKAVINGTTYDVAANAGNAAPAAPAVAANTYVGSLDLSKAVAGIFYLTKDGKVAVYLPTEDVADTTALYAYVTAANKSTSFGVNTIEVKAVLADGTQKVLTVVDNDSTAGNASGLYDAAVADPDNVAGVYSYTLNKDGKMVAGAVITNPTAANKTDGAYTAGKPAMALDNGGGANDTTILLDANTVVLFYSKTGDKETITSYKGVDNVPGIASGVSVTYKVETGKTFAAFILVNAIGQTATADYAYALGNSYTAQTAKGYEYSMVVNGAKVTLTTSAVQDGTNGSVTMGTGKVFTYGVDKDGIATLSAVANVDSSNGVFSGAVDSVTSKYVVVNGKAVELASSYSVDDLTATDSDKNIVPGVGDITNDDSIVYVLSAGKLVKAYVINAGSAATYEAGNANKGVTFAFDGYNIAVNGTLHADAAKKLAIKFTAPAGISANSATIKYVAAANVTAAKAGTAANSVNIVAGKTSVEFNPTLDFANKAIKVEIQWNANYTETYIIDATLVTNGQSSAKVLTATAAKGTWDVSASAATVAANATVAGTTITVNVALNGATTVENDTIVVTPATASVGASVSPATVTLTKDATVNWVSSGTITITAQDGSTEVYTVVVVEA